MRRRVPAPRVGVLTALLALFGPLGGLASKSLLTPSLLAQPLLAQSTPMHNPTDSGAGAHRPGATAPAIAVADVARDLRVFMADSLRVRTTPSAALNAAAAYVAAEFQRLGLSPKVQAYPIPGQQRLDVRSSSLGFFVHRMRKGKPVVAEDGEPSPEMLLLSFQRDVYFAPDVGQQRIWLKQFLIQDASWGDPLTILAGPYTAAAVRQLADTLRDKTVLYVPPANADTAAQRQVVAALYAVAQGVVVAGTSDSARFAAERARAPEAELIDEYMMKSRKDQTPWAIVVGGAPLGKLLAVAGEDVERLRASPTPVMRPLDPQSLTVYSHLSGKIVTSDTLRAPNVIGTLPGSDPALRDECLIIVAPLDTRRGESGAKVPLERVDAGADDGASAVAGLLALARAFTQPGQRPRRSIVFLAASGGTRGEFWGAKYFVHTMNRDPRKSVALALDRLGRWPGNSAMVHGLRDVDVKPPLSWVAGAYPELDLRIVDGGSAVEPVADQFAFVRKAIPSLYVHAADDARTAAADAEQVVRGTRLVFALAQALADADPRPRWSSEGRQQLRTVLEP